ncbi:MAG: asparaginase [Streptosporangiaceae bacterium]
MSIADGSVPPVLAEVVRSGFVESRHHGSVVGIAESGERAFAIGHVRTPVFPRSSNKPLQAAAMLCCGLDLDGELLALAAASHSGESFHASGVRRILARAGLDESALGCPAAFPRDEDALRAVHRQDDGPLPVYMNCSGKHAAMLATCVCRGWPVTSYREPDHPLQVAIRETIERITGESVAAVGVDGCGAPLFAFSLAGLATAYRRIVRAGHDTPEGRVADAMRAHPVLLSGTTRDEYRLMEGVPGLLVKGGAEGVNAFAMPDGRAGALKVADGSARAVVPVTVTALRTLGVEAPVLDDLACTPVLGGDGRVGDVRAVARDYDRKIRAGS